MSIKDFKNKKIAVVGTGIEGLSSAQYLESKGAKVAILDQKDGWNYLEKLGQFDMVVRSPGVRLHLPEFDEYKKRGGELTSQTKLFFELCPSEIIGVTGTKGKGTTSSLIYEMLKKQGYDAYLGGNIGVPPFDFLDKLTSDSKVVLELSSFQLEDLDKSPHIAVLLMITSDHLKGWESENYHDDITSYVESKRNLVRFQKPTDFAILNRDYPATNESDIHTAAQIFYVSRERVVLQGCFVQKGKVVFRKDKDSEEEIIKTSQIKLIGEHNFENVCAAVMAAKLSGVSTANIAAVLKTFAGLPHRIEFCGQVNGIKFYDDSFSTTPETAIAAIQAFKQPEILILGGSPKKSNFTELGEVINASKNIKSIIGIGVEWGEIKKHIKNKKIHIVEGPKDMKEIVQAAFLEAERGDVVLLSPACASFDMFKNYKERGNQFKEEVRKLKEEFDKKNAT